MDEIKTFKVKNYSEFRKKIILNHILVKIIKTEYKNDGYFYISLHAPENELLKLEKLGYKPIS